MAFALSRTTTRFSSEVRDLLVHRHRHHGDPKKLWSAVNWLLQPVTSSTAQHAAIDLAAHFTSKVEKVRTATSDAPPPVINSRQSTMLADLVPVSVEEAAKLLQSAPNKHCQLDPTWILKKSADRSAPLFAALCNSFYSSGLPPSQKHALVSADFQLIVRV